MADHVIKVLNELIETSKDGEKGFDAAADDTKTPELQQLFRNRSSDCAAGAAELQALVSQLGGKPEDHGTVSGAMHRGWTNLKAAIASRSDLVLLEECERGEDVAKAAYAKALKETLPENVRAVVERQYQGVLRNHDQVRDLRNRYRAET
ncbi:PA2169 family four-helix-bundle protein [Achromobacter sp. NPDC058515]|uniref:PA2169 family four-helix-bundle protein n=1 Tax=Achromobacter sp. NPDC058515 TaxID=3346533 RepID=UPI00364A4012